MSRRAVRGGAKVVRSPEDISRDVRGMNLRQRVSLTVDDDVLRDELEEMILERARLSASQVNLRTYQDMCLPSLAGGRVIKPISDIQGAHTLCYSKVERLTRCKLAALYRLIDVLNWGEGIFDRMMCTVQVSEDDNNLLVGPHGLLFSEVTASRLLKVNNEGEVIDKGITNLGVYKPVLDIHLAIHTARNDATCVMFINTEPVKVIAATKAGLLPISLDAVAIGGVSYHNFPGLVLSEDAKESLGNELGPSNKVMILHNFGAICIGETLEETFHTAFAFVKACKDQVHAMRIGIKNLLMVDVKAQGQMIKALEEDADEKKQAKAHFEAWMHWLDSKGYKTAYNYRNPELYKNQKARSPAKPAFKQDKQDYPPGRSKSLGRANDYSNRNKWLNDPVKATQYKQHISEPDFNELDFNKNQTTDNKELEKQDINVPEPESPESYEQEAIVQPNVVEEQHATPDFESNDRNTEKPVHADADVTVTPVRDPDVSPDSPQQPDESVEPEGELVRRRSGKKVKKRRSFREKLMHRISTG